RIPNERVVARTKRRHVISGPTVDNVVAFAANNRVVAGAAVDREIDLAGIEPRRVDRVVTGKTVDRKRVVGGFGAGDLHLRRQAVDDDRITTAGDFDLIVAGGPVDDHGVGLAITLAASCRRRQIDTDLCDTGTGEV